MDKTERFHASMLKRVRRNPLTGWMVRLRGRGFYVIHRKWSCGDGGVVKGVVGEIIVAPEAVRSVEQLKRTSPCDLRKGMIFKVRLYKTPFDVVKQGGAFRRGLIGEFTPWELYLTRREALAEWKRQLVEKEQKNEQGKSE